MIWRVIGRLLRTASAILSSGSEPPSSLARKLGLEEYRADLPLSQSAIFEEAKLLVRINSFDFSPFLYEAEKLPTTLLQLMDETTLKHQGTFEDSASALTASYGLDQLELHDAEKDNPNGTFKDFYSIQVDKQLESGKPHATLGGNLKRGDFGSSGSRVYETLLDLGLKPEHTVVDYGCGTLRVGVHVISHLDPGNFWGMDIAEFLLDKGRDLIGSEVVESKKPNLGVIGPEFVEKAASTNPDFVYSIAVLIHVHPDEASEFFDNLGQLLAAGGTLYMTAKCVEGDETVQYAGRSWAYGLERVRSEFAKRGLTMEILRKQEVDLESVEQKALSLNLTVKK